MCLSLQYLRAIFQNLDIFSKIVSLFINIVCWLIIGCDNYILHKSVRLHTKNQYNMMCYEIKPIVGLNKVQKNIFLCSAMNNFWSLPCNECLIPSSIDALFPRFTPCDDIFIKNCYNRRNRLNTTETKHRFNPRK